MKRPHLQIVPAAEQTPMFNADAEASVLGGILLSKDVLGEIDSLAVNEFFDHRHQVVFAAMRTLQARGEPIDVVTLEVEIEKAGKLDAVGGIAYLGELALRVPTADNVVHYTKIVRDHFTRRSTALRLEQALGSVLRGSLDPREMISELVGDLQRLDTVSADVAAGRDPRLTPELDRFLGEDEPDEDDSEDWIIRDIVPRGEPALWGGRMKSGKTWAALDLAIAIALGQDWLGFENTLRAPARVLGIFREDGKRRLRKRIWELTRARGTSPNDPLLRANLSITREPIRLPDDVKDFIRRARTWGPTVIVIDNITRVMVGDPNSTREAAAFTKSWLDICDQLEASVVFLHHTKKEDDPRADPFASLRGSGDFGAVARNIVLSRPLDIEGEHVSEVLIRGNLDLRRESFALGFERKELLGRSHAKLVDRGEVDAIRAAGKEKRKEAKSADKQQRNQAKARSRREIALEMIRTSGSVSTYQLGERLGLSPNAAAPTLKALAGDGVVRLDKTRGYVFAEPELAPAAPANTPISAAELAL